MAGTIARQPTALYCSDAYKRKAVLQPSVDWKRNKQYGNPEVRSAKMESAWV